MEVLAKAALIFVAFAMPASAQLQPSTPEAIANAVGDCWAAVGPGEVREAALQKRGWQAASWRSPDGQPVASPMKFYGKSGSNVIMTVRPDRAMAACVVASRIARLQDVSRSVQFVRNQLASFDPRLKVAKSGGSVVFLSDPKLALLDVTGTKEAPAIRVAVTYQIPEKK